MQNISRMSGDILHIRRSITSYRNEDRSSRSRFERRTSDSWSRSVFVLESPIPKRLMKALEMNYRAKKHRECLQAGGKVCSNGGLSWTRQENAIDLLFPKLRAEKADAQLARFLRDRRRRTSLVVDVTVGTECTPRGIIAHLISFGFEIPAGGGVPGMAARIRNIPNRAPPDGICASADD